MNKTVKAMEPLFRSAEKALAEVAKKYGFDLHLVDTIKGDWIFYPQVDYDWKPEQKDYQI